MPDDNIQSQTFFSYRYTAHPYFKPFSSSGLNGTGSS